MVSAYCRDFLVLIARPHKPRRILLDTKSNFGQFLGEFRLQIDKRIRFLTWSKVYREVTDRGNRNAYQSVGTPDGPLRPETQITLKAHGLIKKVRPASVSYSVQR